ncbi:hypothetical protein [Nocardioides marmotae]|uniref:hypothetical protein n=1 Tax=Nocardioides marmotae TaxID=2663857 RepID=UPI001CA8408B|nr:hypothetical protein [Nocardioides marmotae]
MSTPPTPTLIVPATFNGPPGSGNGGWCAGALAQHVAPGAAGGGVEVRLCKPPPLDVPMPVGEQDGWTVATLDGAVVLQARPGPAPEPLAPVPLDVATAAAAAYDGFRAHPFAHCFSCGPERAAGDGLRVFPGPVAGEPGVVAAPWTPGPDHATPEATWAAIDCAGAWAAGIGERPMVLGSMTAEVHALPEAGAEHVVVGAVRSRDGRRHHTATTLRAADGRLLAASEQVWFEIDPSAFTG